VPVTAFGRTLAARTAAQTDRQGRIKVTRGLTIPGFPEMYVLGDLAVIGRGHAVANIFGLRLSGLPA